MKKFLLFLPFLLCIFLIASGSAMAVPTLNQILGTSFNPDYSDTGLDLVQLIDTDGTQDDATAFLFLELAGFAATNKFGIYDPDNSSTMLEVFDGGDSPITSVTLAFDIDNGTVTNQTTNVTKNIGTTFGFYLDSTARAADGGGFFYSQTGLNSDGFNHMLLFDTSDNSNGQLLGSDVVVAFEDLLNGGDQDWNDMVVGVSDVQPVPEPTTMVISSLFLLGAGFYVRRKLHRNV
jgi:hypothetical protein